jgi:hypothetical protein
MSEAAAEEVERVQKIVAEADDPDYWYHASRDGSREGHYKSEPLGQSSWQSHTKGIQSRGSQALARGSSSTVLES